MLAKARSVCDPFPTTYCWLRPQPTTKSPFVKGGFRGNVRAWDLSLSFRNWGFARPRGITSLRSVIPPRSPRGPCKTNKKARTTIVATFFICIRGFVSRPPAPNAQKNLCYCRGCGLFCPILRKERDSNPRNIAVQRFSRPPHSTTLPSFQCKSAAHRGAFASAKVIQF